MSDTEPCASCSEDVPRGTLICDACSINEELVVALNERDALRAAASEARDLFRQWLAGKEPGLGTSRWLAKNGRTE